MQITSSTSSLRQIIKQWQKERTTVGFVPTMGFLHDGHLSLMRQAKALAQKVVCSIFVNPTQFNDKRDFEGYPIDLERDAKLLQSVGVDLLFTPSTADIYGEPGTAQSWVTVEELSKPWEGAHRPGHFRGVTTVVSILFNLVKPDLAVFGEKDFQQLRLIEQMVSDLKFDIEIVRGNLVREPDGLAMSSRNVRLSSDARNAALSISRGLAAAAELVASGERRADLLITAVQNQLANHELIKPEYVSVVCENTLQALSVVDRPARILVAAFVDGVRLIDNFRVG